MGSILMGDLDDRLVVAPYLDTDDGRQQLAAARLSLLVLVMVTKSLGHAAQRAESQAESHVVTRLPEDRDYRQAG